MHLYVQQQQHLHQQQHPHQQQQQQQHPHQHQQQHQQQQHAPFEQQPLAAAQEPSPRRWRSSLLESAKVPPLTARTAQLLSEDILVLLQRLQRAAAGGQEGMSPASVQATERALSEACFELERTVGVELKGLLVAELEIQSRPVLQGGGGGAGGALPPPVAQLLTPQQLALLRGTGEGGARSASAGQPGEGHAAPLAEQAAPFSLDDRASAQQRMEFGQWISDLLLHGSEEEALQALGRLPRPKMQGAHY